MTVADVTRKAGPYEFTSGGTYPFYFHVFTETDVYVVVADTDEVETELVYGTDYTVTINDDQDNDPGGIITLKGSWEGYTVTIGSCVPYTQEVVITNKGGFYPNTLNDTFDKLTAEIQQNREIIDRCLKVGIASSSSAEEYKADLEALVDESVASAAAAAESAANASKDATQAANDAANALTQAGNAVSTADTALSQANTAVNTANTAMTQSTTAVNTANSAVAQIEAATDTANTAMDTSNEALGLAQEALETANTADSHATTAVDTANNALESIPSEVAEAIDAQNIPQLVYDEVIAALEGVTIPGLTFETITAALGYVAYDAETNAKDFATNTEVAEAISESEQKILAAIPEQVNADWAIEDETSPAYIKNKSLVEDKIEEVKQTSVPSGLISLWYGSSDAVPDGWAICDGSNGTPDLRDRFVVGAGSSYATGETGGSTSQTVSISTSISGTSGSTTINVSGTSGATTISSSTMPSHYHNIYSYYSAGSAGGLCTYSYDADDRVSYNALQLESKGRALTSYQHMSGTGSGSSHTHSFSWSDSHTHSISGTGTGTGTISILPPYYALFYIMKL